MDAIASQILLQAMRNQLPIVGASVPMLVHKPGESRDMGTRVPNTQFTGEIVRQPEHLNLVPPVPNNPIKEVVPRTYSRNCLACTKDHTPGHCPLRKAKLEQCPSCGYYHLHSRRGCPLLQDPRYVEAMYKRLNESTEDKEVVRAAKAYLAGVRADLTKREKDPQVQ